MAFDHNFSISVFYLLVLHSLSCIVMVSAGCSWSDGCTIHKIFLGQNSTSQKIIRSSSYYRKEFHKISSTPRVKDKVLRLRWISSSFSSKDALVFRIGCTNAKTVKDFHKSDKPHDIYSHDDCIEIERNSISNSKTDRTSFTVIAELINMAGIHRSCSSYPSTSDLASSDGDESGVIISQNWPSTKTVESSFSCVWKLRTDSSKAFRINIMDMDLGMTKTYNNQRCSDTITIEALDWFTKFKKTYTCNPDGNYADDYEKSLETGSSWLKIVFNRIRKPSDGREGRGFVIGWTTYKKSTFTIPDLPKFTIPDLPKFTISDFTKYKTNSNTEHSTKRSINLKVIIPVVLLFSLLCSLCSLLCRKMRASASATARQHGQQAEVMVQLYNRERIAEIDNHNNNNNFQQMNIAEFRRPNHEINLPFHLPPQQYTEVAQSDQPPPSYNEIANFSSQAPSLHQNQGEERGGMPSPPEPKPPTVLPYPPLQATGYQLSPSYQPSVVLSQQQQQSEGAERDAPGVPQPESLDIIGVSPVPTNN